MVFHLYHKVCSAWSKLVICPTINWKFPGRGLDLVIGQLVVMGEREGATGETNLLLIKKNINIISIIYWSRIGNCWVPAHKFLPTPCLRKLKCITMKICLFIQSEIDTRVKTFNHKYCAFSEFKKNFPKKWTPYKFSNVLSSCLPCVSKSWNKYQETLKCEYSVH